MSTTSRGHSAWRAAISAPPWVRVAALLVVELLGLSVFVELPSEGPALVLVAAARLLIPVVIGAGAAAALIARQARRGGAAPIPPPAPRWRAAALAAHALAYVFTAAFGFHLLRPDRAPASLAGFALWLAAIAVTLTLAAFTVASPLALGRRAARRLGVPLLALCVGIVSWRAVATAKVLWEPLRASTLRASAALLRLATDDVILLPEESVIGVGDFSVEVAPVCSGVDGIGLVFVFLALWLSLARARLRPLRAALVLVPAGAAISLGANTLRIAALTMLGAAGHADLAAGAFHSKIGWILFLGIAFALGAAAEHVPWLQREARAPAAEDAAALPAEVGGYVAPLVAALATALLTSALTSGPLDRWYGARLVAAVVTLVAFRSVLPRPTLPPVSWVPLALGAAVCAVWIPWGGARASTLAVEVATLDPLARAAWIAIRLAGACLVIPVIEELAFRGFLLPWLVSPDLALDRDRSPVWGAVVVSSLAFGLVHERFVLGVIAGLAFALARLWRGRLSDAILAHAVANAGVAAAVLLGGRWDLWG